VKNYRVFEREFGGIEMKAIVSLRKSLEELR